MRVGRRPSRYYLKALNTAGANFTSASPVLTQPKVSTIPPTSSRYIERDLHCLLDYFAFHNLRAYCKTINHSRSRKVEFGAFPYLDTAGPHCSLDECENVVDLTPKRWTWQRWSSAAKKKGSRTMKKSKFSEEQIIGILREAFKLVIACDQFIARQSCSVRIWHGKLNNVAETK